MAQERTNTPFATEVRRLLDEQGMSTRALAARAGVSQPYLSRLLRGVKKSPGLEVARAVARALSKPDDYFPEVREALLVDKIKKTPRLRDRLYDELVLREKR